MKRYGGLVLGGAFLASIAGAVNMIGLLGLAQAFLSHATGNVTRTALGLSRGQPNAILAAGLPLLAFFAGTILSGSVTGNERFSPTRRYGILMMVESVFLVAATALFRDQHLLTGELAAALAMGLQNGMVNRVGEHVVRTTHVTGIVTDLGMKIGAILRGATVRKDRLALHGGILTGFFVGGLGGTFAFAWLGFTSLLLPAGLLFAAGNIYLFLRLREPQVLDRAFGLVDG